MEYRLLGTSPLKVSAVCLGTMTYGQQNTEAEAHEQLDYAFSNGINFLDTAEMYPVPPRAETVTRTETIIGNWLSKQKRSEIIVATKAAGPGRSLKWIRNGPSGFDRKNLSEALEGSLRRLKTDYVDLYQLHWPDRNVPMFGTYRFDPSLERPAVPVEEQLEALNGLVKEGKIRYIGLSNETSWGIMEFLRIAREKKYPVIVSVQNAYNLINRGFEFSMAEISYRENVSLLAYSPLAFGLLSGKYTENPDAPGRMNEFSGFGNRYLKPNVPAAVKAYADLARSFGMSPAAMALAFVYRQHFTGSTIIGATSMQQLKENIEAFQLVLTKDQLEAIEQIHMRYMNPAP